MKITTKHTHKLTLTTEELCMLEAAIGSTSVNSRVDAGMSREHSQFISEFYNVIAAQVDAIQ